MKIRDIEKSNVAETNEVRDFKKTMREYGRTSFALHIPQNTEKSAIFEWDSNYFQVSRVVMLLRIEDVICSKVCQAEEEDVMQNYDGFEKRLKEEDFAEYGICMNKKRTGICAVNDEAILLEDVRGYFLCAMEWIVGVSSAEKPALKYGLFVYNPIDHKSSKVKYYDIDKELFNVVFGIIKVEGDFIE